MRGLRDFAFLAMAAILVASCSSTQFGDLAQVVAAVAGSSAEESRQIGNLARTFGEATLHIDYEQERVIGGGVAVKAFQEFGAYYEDPALQRYVTLVGKSVALTCERPEIPYAFAVIDNDVPNAFAGPGGYVFITVGTLRNLSDEAQLAGVLGHEIAHVCKRHALTTLQRGKLLRAVAEGTSLVDPENAAAYAGAVGEVETVLFTKGLDKKFEYEADLTGTDYAAMAGYNPWGLREYLARLGGMQGVTGGWFQTHPSVDTRLKRLDAHLRKTFSDYGDLPRARERFERNVTHRLAPSR